MEIADAATARKGDPGGRGPHSAGGEHPVPLANAAESVGGAYPDLLRLQRENDGGRRGGAGGARGAGDDGPLPEFCRRALFTEGLRRACARSLRAEADRLDSVGLDAAAIQRVGRR